MIAEVVATTIDHPEMIPIMLEYNGVLTDFKQQLLLCMVGNLRVQTSHVTPKTTLFVPVTICLSHEFPQRAPEILVTPEPQGKIAIKTTDIVDIHGRIFTDVLTDWANVQYTAGKLPNALAKIQEYFSKDIPIQVENINSNDLFSETKHDTRQLQYIPKPIERERQDELTPKMAKIQMKTEPVKKIPMYMYPSWRLPNDRQTSTRPVKPSKPTLSPTRPPAKRPTAVTAADRSVEVCRAPPLASSTIPDAMFPGMLELNRPTMQKQGKIIQGKRGHTREQPVQVPNYREIPIIPRPQQVQGGVPSRKDMLGHPFMVDQATVARSRPYIAAKSNSSSVPNSSVSGSSAGALTQSCGNASPGKAMRKAKWQHENPMVTVNPLALKMASTVASSPDTATNTQIPKYLEIPTANEPISEVENVLLFKNLEAKLHKKETSYESNIRYEVLPSIFPDGGAFASLALAYSTDNSQVKKSPIVSDYTANTDVIVIN